MALHEPPSGAAAEITGSFSQHQQQLCPSCLSESNVGDEIEAKGAGPGGLHTCNFGVRYVFFGTASSLLELL